MDTPQTSLPQNSFANFTPAPPTSRAVDPDNPPWGIFGALGLLILSFLLMAVIQVAFLLVYAVKRGIAFTPEAIVEFATKDPNALFVQVVAILPAHVLTLGLAWLLVTRGGKHPFLRTLGWEWTEEFTFWRCAALAVLLLVVGTGIIWLTGKPENALERLLESSRAAALATAFAATFTAPLVEEIAFRGLLYSALQRAVGTVWAVAVVMLIFAAIHVPQYWPSFGVIGTILLLSFVLTALRARTGRLLPSFIVHLVFNGIQSILIVLSPYIETPSVPEPSPAPALLLSFIHMLARNHW